MRQCKLIILMVVFCISFSGYAFAEKRLIAVVMAGDHPRYQDVHSTFVANSTSFCASDCKIYVQTPNADVMSLRNAVRKAVAIGADLIITYGPLSTLAAQAEVPPVPTLFADVYDPAGLGLVSKKTLVGNKMSGVRGDGPIQGLLKYFLESVDVASMAVLYDLNSPEGLLQKEALERFGNRRGVEIVSLGVSHEKKHLDPLDRIPDDTDGVFLASSEHDRSQLGFVIGYTSARNIPVITQRPNAAELGAFMVLETSAKEQGEALADMAGKVLSGKDVEELSMHRPRQVSFVVNLKVAKKYGIEMPIQILSNASRVIR